MKCITVFLFTALLSAISLADAKDATEDDAFFQQLVSSAYVEPFRNGDVERWITAFDDNAIALHNRRPMDKGKSAIEAFGQMVHQYFELREYEVHVTEIRHSANWVYTAGSFTTLFVAKKDGSMPFGREQGKFLLLWERQADSQWKIILDMGNSNQ